MAELTIKLTDGKTQPLTIPEAWVEGFIQELQKSERVVSIEVNVSNVLPSK